MTLKNTLLTTAALVVSAFVTLPASAEKFITIGTGGHGLPPLNGRV